MLQSVTFTAGETTQELRLTTGALMRFEEDNGGAPFDALLDKLIQGKGGIRLLVSALAAGLNNGAGASKEEAIAAVDAVGGARLMVPFVAEAIAKAFPAPKKGEGKAAGKASPPAGV